METLGALFGHGLTNRLVRVLCTIWSTILSCLFGGLRLISVGTHLLDTAGLIVCIQRAPIKHI